MALRNSHGLRLPEAFLAPPLPCNQMGHCVAPPTTHCIRRGDDPSAMAPCGFYMLRASAIVAPVRGSAQCQESSATIKPRLREYSVVAARILTLSFLSHAYQHA